MATMIKCKGNKTSICDYVRISRFAGISFDPDELSIMLHLGSVWWWKHKYISKEEYESAADKTHRFIDAMRKAVVDGTIHLSVIAGQSEENFSALTVLGCERIVQPNSYRMGSDIKFKEDELVKELVDSYLASK